MARLLLASVMLCASLAHATVPTIIQPSQFPQSNQTVTGNKIKYVLPAALVSGDINVCFLSYGNGSTGGITGVSDDGSNTYQKDGYWASNDSQMLEVWSTVASSAARVVTVSFDNAYNYTPGMCVRMNNVPLTSPTTARVDATCGRGYTSNATTWSCPSAMTTTSDGDEIVCGGYQTSIGENGTSTPDSFTAKASPAFSLLTADNASYFATEYYNQATHGAITPSITSSVSTHYLFGCVAYKTGTSGGSAPTGVNVQAIKFINLSDAYAVATNMGTTPATQFPCPGCNGVAVGYNTDASITMSAVPSMTSPTATATCPTRTQSAHGITTGFCHFTNVTMTAASVITLHFNTAPTTALSWNAMIWGIAGAATSPIDADFGGAGVAVCSAYGNNTATLPTTLSNAPGSCTTSTTNELVTAFIQEENEAVYGCGSSTGTNICLVPDSEGVYYGFSYDQDGGFSHTFVPTATTVSLSWLYAAYEGPGVINDWAAVALAWKPVAASTARRRVTVIQ
jgi:hypothetical protein